MLEKFWEEFDDKYTEAMDNLEDLDEWLHSQELESWNPEQIEKFHDLKSRIVELEEEMREIVEEYKNKS
ncbi:MAG: hypothetical protein ABEI53_01610 [Candidatus Magasanikbacteria bacterium]